MSTTRNCADLKVASYILIERVLASRHFSTSDVRLMELGFTKLQEISLKLNHNSNEKISGKICYIDTGTGTCTGTDDKLNLIVKEHTIGSGVGKNYLLDNHNHNHNQNQKKDKQRFVVLLLYDVISYSDQVSGAEPGYKKDFVPHINNNCYDVGIGMTRKGGYAMKSSPGEGPLMYACGQKSKSRNMMFLCPLVTGTIGLENGRFTCEYMKRVILDFKKYKMGHQLVSPETRSPRGFNRTIMFFSNEVNKKDFHFYLLMRPPPLTPLPGGGGVKKQNANANANANENANANADEEFLARIGITVPFFYHKAGWSNYMGIVDKTGALMVNPREQCRGVPGGISYGMACDKDITYAPSKPNSTTP